MLQLQCLTTFLHVRFDGDSQCHLMYGPGWRLYTGEVNREKVDICRAIWCRRHYSLRCVYTARSAQREPPQTCA